MEEAIGVSAACRVLGKCRVHAAPAAQPAGRPPAGRKEFHHPAELSPEEKERVLAVLDSPRFADKAVAQAYTVLLDEGIYLCSQATMHRLLRERGTSPASAGPRQLTRRRRNPSCLPPALIEVWCWDITKLKGPARGNLVPAVRHPRHLLEKGHPLGDLADRDRYPGEGIHRARHRRQRRHRAARRARRPRHLDDL